MSVEQVAVGVVIGRAGSKGLPRKNVIPFRGRPMICWSIDAAREAHSVGRVIVSTDGPDIAAAARAMNVEVIDRPAPLATDLATVDSAVRHAVDASRAAESVIVILYANVPIRPPRLIDRAVATLLETGADSVQSYCEVGKQHPYWMVKLDGESRVSPFIPNTVYRRQDLPKLLLPDGGVIAATRESLFTVSDDQPHAFLGRDRRGIVTQPGEVIDIDTPHDLAAALAAGKRAGKNNEPALR